MTDSQVQMTARVPQGSVLGPVLWNITYDWALGIPLERNSTIIEYADDTLLLIKSNNVEDTITKAKLQLSRTLKRIQKLGLPFLSSTEKKINIDFP